MFRPDSLDSNGINVYVSTGFIGKKGGFIKKGATFREASRLWLKACKPGPSPIIALMKEGWVKAFITPMNDARKWFFFDNRCT